MVGRDEEIAELRAIAEGDRSCLVVVYGRRRIGKRSALHPFSFRSATSK